MVRTFKPLAIFLLAYTLAPIAAASQAGHCSTNEVVEHQVQVAEENPITLKQIIFTGNTVLPVAEQEKISAVLSKSTFRTLQAVGEKLKTQVRHEWQRRGYFKVELGEPEIKPDGDNRSLSIAMVWVEAGKQYRMGEMRFLKNTAFPVDKLRSLFPIQTGDVFDTGNVGKGIEEVRKLYGERGYINMSVVPTAQVEKDSDSVDLTLEMDEGQQFRVGKVEVLGANEAKRHQFISQSGLIEGSIYDSSRLQKAFATGESDGFESTEDSVTRTINEADSTVDFRVDLTPCVSISRK
jgi:outer membrane protein assembly factor BamA